MPGTLDRPDFFEHLLVAVKTASRQHRLDFDAVPKSGETLFEGGVMSLDSAGQFIKGVVADSANNAPMPIFAIQNDTDFDANSEVGNISGGVMSGLVASGAFEVSTTEFKTPATYNPNDTLTAGLNGGGDAGLVLLSGGNYSDTVICGIVSRGVTSGVAVDNNDLLHFWTVYVPAIRASGLV